MAEDSTTLSKGNEVETWKPVRGFENYLVSNLGNVKSIQRVVYYSNGHRALRKERIKKQRTTWNGRKEIQLHDDGVSKFFLVHRLVAFAFLGDPPDKYEVNHKDGNPLNNNLSNLEWVSRSYNNHHSWVIGLKNQDGVKNPSSKLTNEDVIVIKNLLKGGVLSQVQIAEKFKVSSSLISQIHSRRIWDHIEV